MATLNIGGQRKNVLLAIISSGLKQLTANLTASLAF